MITIYTTPRCSYCVRAKNLMKSRQIAFEELEVGKDITVEDYKAFSGRTSVPFIVGVGGYEDLVKVIIENPNYGKLLLNE